MKIVRARLMMGCAYQGRMMLWLFAPMAKHNYSNDELVLFCKKYVKLLGIKAA